MAAAVTLREERRSSARRLVERDEASRTFKLGTGASIVVVNRSPAGLLVESPVRLNPGAAIEVRPPVREGAAVMRAEVVHCQVCALDRFRGLRYRAGLRFVASSAYPACSHVSSRGKSLHGAAVQSHSPGMTSARLTWRCSWHADC